jgi:hypothetical protein
MIASRHTFKNNQSGANVYVQPKIKNALKYQAHLNWKGFAAVT